MLLQRSAKGARPLKSAVRCRKEGKQWQYGQYRQSLEYKISSSTLEVQMEKIKFSIILIGLFLAIGCAGMQQINDAERSFERIVQVPGHKKDKIYDFTKIWIAENFRSAKSVIEYENRESGTIIGNGAIKYPCKGIECVAKSDWKVLFTMRVDTKNEKIRLTFSNLKLTWPPSYNRTFGAQSGHEGPVYTKADLNKIKPVLLNFGDEIRTHLEKGSDKSNW